MFKTAFWVVALCGVGCAPSLDLTPPREPDKEVPAFFGSSRSREDVSPAAVADVAQSKWNELFASEELRSLIEASLHKNQELNERLQETIVARSEVSAREGEYLPKLAARAGVGVERAGEHTSQGVSDEAHRVPTNLGNFTFGLAASWEIDVWKRLRNAAQVADLHYRATVEGRNFIVTQIVAEIARSYYELCAIDNQLEVLKRNIGIQQDALEVIKFQKQAARVTELAVQRFEAEVLKNKSRLYEIEQERVQTENRINFIVGRYPQPVKRDARKFLEPLPDMKSSGLPSQLLDNRPDVRQAALEVQAAKLDVKVAKSAFYPSLSIDAGAGYRSFNAEHLLETPASVYFGVGASVTVPLLNRQGIEAQYRTASARQLQAVFAYERTLLQAFTDVANQLAKIDNLQKSYELQSHQVETLGHSIESSYMLFTSARADYMEVLLTRRDSLEAEMELIETRKRQLQARVNVYQALGGGWRSGT